MITLGNRLTHRFNPQSISSQMYEQVDTPIVEEVIYSKDNTKGLTYFDSITRSIEDEVLVLVDFLSILEEFKQNNKKQIDMFIGNQQGINKPIVLGKPIKNMIGYIKAFTCIPDDLMCTESLRENLFNCNDRNPIYQIETDIFREVWEYNERLDNEGINGRTNKGTTKSQGVIETNYNILQLFSQILL